MLCPRDFIPMGIRSTFSKRSISGTALTTTDEPTTEGIIAAMRRHDFGGHHVGVQLYPRNPNRRLMDFIKAVGAVPDPVVPYGYVSKAGRCAGARYHQRYGLGPVRRDRIYECSSS